MCTHVLQTAEWRLYNFNIPAYKGFQDFRIGLKMKSILYSAIVEDLSSPLSAISP